MAFISRKNLRVHWAELKPIESRMTQKDKAWFNLFLHAYYLQNKAALAELTKDEAVFKSVWSEAIWLSNEGRRNKTSDTRAYGSDYTGDDWLGDEEGFSAEDAIIEAIDYKRSIANGKEKSTVPSTKSKDSRAKSKSSRNTKASRNDNSVRPGKAPLMASGGVV